MKDAIAASQGAGDLLPFRGAARWSIIRATCPTTCLQLLPANGGVVMVNFVPNFISEAMWQWGAEKDAEAARLESFHRNSTAEVDAGLKAWVAAHPHPIVTVAAVADNVEHVAKVAGYDHVGIGGDLDGIEDTVEGLTGRRGLSQFVRRADPSRLERPEPRQARRRQCPSRPSPGRGGLGVDEECAARRCLRSTRRRRR